MGLRLKANSTKPLNHNRLRKDRAMAALSARSWSERVRVAMMIARMSRTWQGAVDEIVRRGLAEDTAEAESLINDGDE